MEHTARMMETTNAYKMILGGSKRRREDNIKMDLGT
jgi:hypothetical protein